MNNNAKMPINTAMHDAKNNHAGNNIADCKTAASVIPDLLLDPATAPAAAHRHLADCASCRQELAGLQQTMQLLDQWEATAPSPFWNARMGALLREEQARPARGWAGFKERLLTRVWLTNYSLKPAAGIAALGLVLAVGGGTWLDLATHAGPRPATTASTVASNTVQDLESLNENAQVFQQMSALDDNDAGAGVQQ